MDIMLEQGDGLTGYDVERILRKFNDAYNMMKTIASAYNARRLPRNVALLMAFVHPEVMRDPEAANLVNRVNDETGESNRIANDLELIRAYVGDGTRPNKNFVDILEDLRTGPIVTSLVGQRRGEAEDDASSAKSVEKFMADADKMSEDIDNNESLTCQNKLNPALQSTDPVIAADAAKLNRAINWNMLFGYTPETAGGNTPEERDNAWRRLQILEHWFINAITSNSSIVVDRTGSTKSIYAFTKKLIDFLNTNPDVVEVINELNQFYGDSYDNDVVKQVAKKIKVSHESSMGQMAAMVAMSPKYANMAISALRDAQPPENRDKYNSVLEKLTNFRQYATKNLAVNMNEWGETNAVNQLNEMGAENPQSTALAAMISNTDKSPAVTWFRKTIDPKFAKGNNEGFSKFKMIGALVDHPDMLTGLVDDPENIPDDIGVKQASTNEEKKNSKNGYIDDETNDERLKKSTITDTPYARARSYTEKDSESKLFKSIGSDSPMNMRVLGPEDDVTGAFVLPKVVVPLFSKDIRYPSSSNDLEDCIYRYSFSMGVAAIIYASREGTIDISSWYDLNENQDGEGGTSYNAHIKPDYIQQVDKNNAFINRLNGEIATCFANIAAREPAEAVIARNKWVDILTDKNKWAQVYNPILRYLVSRFDTKGELDEVDAEKMAMDIRTKLGRLIFNIKVGSVDYSIPDASDNLVVKNVRPYNPVNTSENGRLRKTGGIEGSVTAAGNDIIAYAKGRVKHTSEDNGSLEDSGKKYSVSFGDKTLGSDVVSESELDSWEPRRLVIAPDSDDRTAQYSLWVGLQFCSLMSDEGPENIERYPNDIIKASNDIYRDDAAYTGTAGSKFTPREATSAIQALHVTTGPAMKAVNDLSNAMESDYRTDDFNTLMEILNTAIDICPQESKAEINEHCTISAMLDKGDNSLAAASDVISTLVDTIYREYTGDVGNDAAYLAMSKIMEYCEDTNADEMTKLLRAFSAINALTRVAYTDPETNNPVFVGDKPFTVKCADNTVTVTEQNTRINYVDRYPAIHNTLGKLMTETRNLISKHIENLNGIQDEVHYYYRRAVIALEALSESYKHLITGDLEFYRDRGDRMYDIILNLMNDDVKNTLAEYIDMLKKYIGEVPELTSRTIFDIHKGIPAALDMGSAMTKFKTGAAEPKFNSTRAHSDGTRLYGDDVAGVPGMNIDDITEKDAIDAHPMYDNVKDKIEEFDTDGADNYSGVTNYPMLGMVKTDQYGMKSGSDNLNITTGISPIEFERVSLALDDAHNYVTNALDGVRGKNIPIRERMLRETAFVYYFINKLYPFMASTQSIDERDVLDDAQTISNSLTRAASECLDDAVKDEAVNCARLFSDAVNRVREATPEMTRSTSEANLVAARTFSTALANIILFMTSLNLPESIPGKYGGMEQYGPEESGKMPVGNAGLYTTLSAMPPVAPEKSGKTRTQTKQAQNINQMVNARIGAGNNGDDRLVRSLSEFYKLLGRGNTAGFKESIIPYMDLLGKLKKKDSMTYRNLYTGAAKTALGAALVWAITTDEASGGTEYPTLSRMVDALCSPNLIPVEVPVFLVNGIRMEKDEWGHDRLDMDRLVPVLFTKDGKAISAARGVDNMPAKELDSCVRFNDIAGLWDYLKLDTVEGVTNSKPASVDDLARNIRVGIIADKYDNGEIVANLRRDKQDVNAAVYEQVISDTRTDLLTNASKTKADGDSFVPFSVLYACIDENYLTAAMTNVTGSSVEYINRKQSNTFYNDMMSRINGGVTEEPMDEIVRKYEGSIVYSLATALAREAEGNLDEDSRDMILNMQCPDPEHPDRTIPDSSMNVLLGNNAGRLLDDCVAASKDSLNPNMVGRDYIKLAQDFLSKEFFADPADDKREIARTLVDMVIHAKDNNAGIDYDAGLEKITSLLGAKSNGIAEELYTDYLKMLRTPGNPVKAAALPIQRLRNTAIRMVIQAYEASSEFRNYYRAAHRSSAGDFQQARVDTHALPPIPAYEKIGGIGGVQQMYKKTYDVLVGNVSKEDGADYLDDVNFTIDNLGGAGAIERFNEIADRIIDDVHSLVLSTCEGIAETLNGETGENGKPSDNAMGNHPFDREYAGMSRIRLLNKLDNDMGIAKKSIGMQAPTGKNADPEAKGTGEWDNNGINAAVSTVVNTYCKWSTSNTTEELDTLLEQLGSDETLEEIDNTLKQAIGTAFATASKLYSDGVVLTANAASNFRGVASKVEISDARLDTILNKLCTKPNSPIREADSDMMDDYEINGVSYGRGECFAILRDAIQMLEKSTGVSINDLSDNQLMSPDFYECIRRCISMKKDYGLTSQAIMEFFIRTMIKYNYFKPSDAIPNSMMWYVTRKKPGVKTNDRVRARFDIPLNIVDDVVSSAVKNMKITATSNQWEQFAEDFEKYTVAGNYSRNKKITDPALKDDLVKLFRSVNNGLLAKMDNALAYAYRNGLNANNPVTADNGIVVSMNGARLRELLDVNNEGEFNQIDDDLAINPDEAPEPPEENPAEPPENPAEPPENPVPPQEDEEAPDEDEA